jgi:flagellar basal body-associated protein FliL
VKKNINILQKITGLLLLALYCLPATAVEGKLIVTTYPNFYDRFYKNHAEVPMASLPPTQQVYKKQVFYMLPLITGFATDANKKANLTYTLTIKMGDKAIMDRRNVKSITKIVTDTTAAYLSETVLTYEFNDAMAEGIYTIEVLLTDNIQKTSTLLTEYINVSTYTFKENRFTQPDSFFIWQNYYYEGYQPDREIDGLMFFSFPQMQSNAENTLPMLGFFAEVFKGKPHLQRELDSIYTRRNNNERLTIIHICHLAGYMPASLQKKFTADEKKYYNELKEYGLPIIPDSTVKDPFLLNLLWGKFFATGSYDYAKKIVETLELKKYEGSLERFNESKKTEQDKKGAFWETVYQKDVQDLKLRLPNHLLFNGYCLYMIDAKQLTPEVAKDLERSVVR